MIDAAYPLFEPDVNWCAPPEEWWQTMYDAAPAAPAPEPYETQDEREDRAGVRWFAEAMLEKLALKRAEGRGGWWDANECSVEQLERMMHEHCAKGDPVDVANFCMMIWNRKRAAPAPEPGFVQTTVDIAKGAAKELMPPAASASVLTYRLRKVAEQQDSDCIGYPGILWEAADELDRLARELEEVTQERDRYHDAMSLSEAKAIDRAERAEADLARATDHLRHVLPMAKGWEHEHPVGENKQMIADADAFLARAEKEKQ